MRLTLLAFIVALVLPAAAAGTQADYVIGSQDILAIAVWDQPDLAGKYTVELDGTIGFPLIGRVKAGGLTLRDFEMELKRRLSDGYFKNPQVTVAVEQYRSQRIFIVGDVRAPGTYPLTGDMTLIEALARAGYTAAREVVIVRSRGAQGPVLPGQDKNADVVRVDLKEFESGQMSQNVRLSDGDTIFVPQTESDYVYVFGEVRSPGVHVIKKDTTVLQVLSIAGGLTEFASASRMKVVRVVDGKKKEVRVKMTDILQPGDTLIVPERFF
jgi:polysaccharide export outer membrane protein